MSLDVPIEKDALMYSRKEIDDKVKEGKEKSIKIIDEAAKKGPVIGILHLVVDVSDSNTITPDKILIGTIVIDTKNKVSSGEAYIPLPSSNGNGPDRLKEYMLSEAGSFYNNANPYKFSPTAILKFFIRHRNEIMGQHPAITFGGYSLKPSDYVFAPSLIYCDRDKMFFDCDQDTAQIEIQNDGTIKHLPKMVKYSDGTLHSEYHISSISGRSGFFESLPYVY